MTTATQSQSQSLVIRLTNHLARLQERKIWGRPELPPDIHEQADFQFVEVSPHFSFYNAEFASGSVIWTVYVGSNDYTKCVRWLNKLHNQHLALYAEVRPAKRMSTYQFECKVWGLNETYLAQLIEYDLKIAQAEQELAQQTLTPSGEFTPVVPETIHPDHSSIVESQESESESITPTKKSRSTAKKKSDATTPESKPKSKSTATRTRTRKPKSESESI